MKNLATKGAKRNAQKTAKEPYIWRKDEVLFLFLKGRDKSWTLVLETVALKKIVLPAEGKKCWP